MMKYAELRVLHGGGSVTGERNNLGSISTQIDSLNALAKFYRSQRSGYSIVGNRKG
jgi:hypothetical protein